MAWCSSRIEPERAAPVEIRVHGRARLFDRRPILVRKQRHADPWRSGRALRRNHDYHQRDATMTTPAEYLDAGTTDHA
jgi:hypothetical protein